MKLKLQYSKPTLSCVELDKGLNVMMASTPTVIGGGGEGELLPPLGASTPTQANKSSRVFDNDNIAPANLTGDKSNPF